MHPRVQTGLRVGRSEGFPLAAYFIPGRDGMGAWPNSKIVGASSASVTNTSDFDNYGFWNVDPGSVAYVELVDA